MTTTQPRPALGLAFVLRVGALVLFILAVIAGFADWSPKTWQELTAAGLACWVGSTLVP